MDLLVSAEIPCPWCGDVYETMIDTSQDATSQIEDCAICCRPIELALAMSLYALQGVVVAYLVNYNKTYMIRGGVERLVAMSLWLLPIVGPEVAASAVPPKPNAPASIDTSATCRVRNFAMIPSRICLAYVDAVCRCLQSPPHKNGETPL